MTVLFWGLLHGLSCHYLSVSAHFISSSFTKSKFAVPERGRSPIILMWGEKKWPSVHVWLNRNVSSSSPFLCCCFFTLDLSFSCRLVFSSHKIFGPIHASGLNKSNLSCWKRKHLKPLMCSMVISCDRGGGGEQQHVGTLLVEEVMVFLHLPACHRLWPRVMKVMEGLKGGAEVAWRLQRVESFVREVWEKWIKMIWSRAWCRVIAPERVQIRDVRSSTLIRTHEELRRRIKV